MIKKLQIITLLLSSTLFGVDIPLSTTQLMPISKSIELNSQIIQLGNASQSVTSQISGHLEKYYVSSGQRVIRGQKIALIESIEVSKMTANYISLKKQYISLEKNYNATKKLYDGGIISMQELNNQSIKKNVMLAKINSLKSQLQTLQIDTKKLKKATPNFILYAHSSGKISQLLQPLHSVISVDQAIITIIKEQAFYLKSYLPLEYAGEIKVGQKMVMHYNGSDIVAHINQILPALDKTTQRIILLSSIDENRDDLYINTYVKSTLYLSTQTKYVTILKSALSLFQNEWVVFVPLHHEDEHDEHHKEDEHHDEQEHEEHAEHDKHDEEPAFEARVIKIITQNEKYVAIEGLELDEEYVSDKSYYIKSMMLKSSLGGHGH